MIKKLFPDIVFTYPKPVNFDEKNPEFDIFKNVSDEDCPSPQIELVKKVRISTNSVVFRYFKIFPESCIGVTYKIYSKGYGFFLKFIFPKINFSKKRFLLITDEWCSNYYHWHIFALSRLVLLQKENLAKDVLLVLPKKYQRFKFVLPSLAKFGIDKKQIVFLPRKSNIKVAETTLFKMHQHHPILFKEVRKVLIQKAGDIDLKLGSRIYISRLGQVLRFVENEQELVKLLEKYGFKKVIIDQFSYEEQIAICNKAQYVISSHGAGLTNILFMPKGSSVLEMATAPYEEKQVTDYYKLAAMMEVNYFYQLCECGPNSPVRDFHQGSLVVDLSKLEKNLKLMLKENDQ